MKLYKLTIYGLLKTDLPNSFHNPRQIQLLYSRELHCRIKEKDKKESINRLFVAIKTERGAQSGNKMRNSSNRKFRRH